MTDALLAEIHTRLVSIPLIREWGPTVRSVQVIVVTAVADDGAVGHGFSWTPSIGARAVLAMIDEDLAPFAIGRPSVPMQWQANWEHLHEAGSGGVTTIALAGLDLALWDLQAKRAGRNLTDLLGRRRTRQPVYGSGVNLHYTIDELTTQVERWIASGLGAVKIKVGKPDLKEDLERVAAVRELLGPTRRLMIDANQRWSLTTATQAVEALQEFAIEWLEEPLRSDDLTGYAQLRRRADIPIALGENLHTWYRFRDFMDAEAVDVVQPNIIRVGGITPFTIAQLARERDVTLAPHLLPELSAQLALALPEETWIEDVEAARFEQLGALARPVGVEFGEGWVSAGPSVGLGFSFLDGNGNTPCEENQP